MDDKAVEVAAKAFTVALLSSVLMLVVGYAEVRETRSSRADSLRLQSALLVIQSFSQSTRERLTSYFSERPSTESATEEVRIRTLLVALTSARVALEHAARRVGMTGVELATSQGPSPNRIDLVASTNKLLGRLYFTDLQLSEQSIGSLSPQPTLADLSIDVLARLGVAASADPIKAAERLS